MNKTRWQVKTALVFLALSASFYLLHFAVFRDAHHILIYLVGDIAFVFIEVLMVTLIIDELLGRREKANRLEKLNMVIGVFFHEVGNRLLKDLISADLNLETIRGQLLVKPEWNETEFRKAAKTVAGYDCNLSLKTECLLDIKTLLLDNDDFLLRLIENPVLLEHETFTELLMAVFHLVDEIKYRENIEALSESDLTHIAVDMKRAYMLLIKEWLSYMKHIKTNYPYLFMLAVKINPFNK